MSAAFDVGTDDGLRHALRRIDAAGSWEVPAGYELLSEMRRRAVRNAARVCSTTGAVPDRGLADDVLSAAWMVLRRNTAEVLNADRPWAYLMYSAQRQVAAEARAEQLLTSPSVVRGRARHLLPQRVRRIGAAPAELLVALRHEPSGGADRSVVRQVGHHEMRPLLDEPEAPSEPVMDREPWFEAFIQRLVDHGADRAVTTSAVDRLSDLCTATPGGTWEWQARRDPVLAGLGLSPDQCGALVALLAGSRKFRHDGREDSVLGATRTAFARGGLVTLTPVQRRRVAVYVGRPPRAVSSAATGASRMRHAASEALIATLAVPLGVSSAAG
jgi:hypothetical protein